MSFTEKLGEAELEYFNEVGNSPFQRQAVAFLNAYWPEVETQKEFIYCVAWDWIKKADMEAKGISLIHKYNEGCDLDFDIALYFYEQLCKFVLEGDDSQWRTDEYKLSRPEMMTAINRKKELRDKVDVNFDGRVSMLEYLLYQYRDVANPLDFCARSMAVAIKGEHPEIRAARLALEEVNKRIQAYEAEKSRLTEEAAKPGVKGLRAKNMLAQVESGPLWEQLNEALIKAEAAVRIATRKFGSGKMGSAVSSGGGSGGGDDRAPRQATNDGAIWWMNRDLAEKKKRYGRTKK